MARQIRFEDFQNIPKSKASHTVVLLLDQLQNPENIAGISRLADAFGVEEIIFYKMPTIHNTLAFKKISRSTFSNYKHTYIKDISELKATFDTHLWVGLEWTDESIAIKDHPFDSDTLLVMGNERKGIHQPLLDSLDMTIHIPLFGKNSSINVKDACAIALYEWRRNE